MVKDKDIREGILNILDTIGVSLEKLYLYIREKDYKATDVLIEDMVKTLSDLAVLTLPYKEQDNIRVHDLCVCLLDSLSRIRQCFFFNPDRACEKILFEAASLLEYGQLHYEYWGCAYPDKGLIEQFKKKMKSFYINESVRAAVEEGTPYRYDVSIVVTAYNHLDYTKACVNSIMENLPMEMSCELILINHGSSDGTKEYFESVYPTKQIDIKVNRAVPMAMYGVCEGKYLLFISNDIIVTPNALTNLCRTIDSDDKIGWVVPATSNVSNYQTPEVDYKDFDEMLAYASRNNVYDVKRHEERVRLCNPVTVIKSEVMNQANQELYVDLCGSIDHLAFPDDKYALWFRRNGYKMILAKDAFCHHGGSITLREEIGPADQQKELYFTGIEKFVEQYGIDPWGKGACFSKGLIDEVEIKSEGEVNILGIQCGLGSNPLKIREMHKEKTLKGTIYNVTDHKYYYLDQKSVSDYAFLADSIEAFVQNDRLPKFDYVIIEDTMKKGKMEILSDVLPLSQKGVQIFVRNEGEIGAEDVKTLEGFQVRFLEKWIKIVAN